MRANASPDYPINLVLHLAQTILIFPFVRSVCDVDPQAAEHEKRGYRERCY